MCAPGTLGCSSRLARDMALLYRAPVVTLLSDGALFPVDEGGAPMEPPDFCTRRGGAAVKDRGSQGRKESQGEEAADQRTDGGVGVRTRRCALDGTSWRLCGFHSHLGLQGRAWGVGDLRRGALWRAVLLHVVVVLVHLLGILRLRAICAGRHVDVVTLPRTIRPRTGEVHGSSGSMMEINHEM